MSRLLNKIAIGAALFVAVAVLLSLPAGSRRPLVAQAVGACPINVEQHGSTTVAEYSDLTVAPFTQTGGVTGPDDSEHWGPGTTLTLVEHGSNGGIRDLDANVPGGNTAFDYQAIGAQMSRKPVNSGSSFEPGVIGAAAGSETKYNYFWNVANDAFAMMVSTDPSMDPIFNNGLTLVDLNAIYGWSATHGSAPFTLQWNQLPSAVDRGLTAVFPATVITPAFRVASGGSYSDFNAKAASVSNAVEDATYLDVYPGDVGETHRNLSSALMAQQAQTAGVIAYSSLSQVASHPGARIIPMAATSAGPFVIATDFNVPSLPAGLQRLLYVGTHDNATSPREGNSNQVRVDDWINLARSAQGQAIWAAAGYPVIPPAEVPAIPDWDVDLSGKVLLPDLLSVAQKWGATSTCRGWIRQDVDNDGWVSLTDIGRVINHWSQNGLICDAAHSCLRDPSDPPQ